MIIHPLFHHPTLLTHRAFDLAISRASRDSSRLVTPDHLALALLNLPDSKAKALLLHQINRRKIAEAIRQSMKGNRKKTIKKNQVSESRALRRVMSLAIKEARNQNHNYVATDHLILALVRCKMMENHAGQILRCAGINLQFARARSRSLSFTESH